MSLDSNFPLTWRALLFLLVIAGVFWGLFATYNYILGPTWLQREAQMPPPPDSG